MAQRPVRFRRRSPGFARRGPPLLDFFVDFGRFVRRHWRSARIPLTVLAVAHLALVAVLPGGRNMLFGVEREDTPGYLSTFRVPDALGFDRAARGDFLVYKIFTQDGGVLNGVFPDTGVAPRLRYDRWARLGDVATGPFAALHRKIVEYVLERLPSPPVRLELFAARWEWNRNAFAFPFPGTHPETELDLRLLGTYNGLTREWRPAKAAEGRQ